MEAWAGVGWGRVPQGHTAVDRLLGSEHRADTSFWGRGTPPMRGSVWTTPLVSNIPFVSTGATQGSGHPNHCSPDSGSLIESSPTHCPQVDRTARLAPPDSSEDPPSSSQAGPPTAFPWLPAHWSFTDTPSILSACTSRLQQWRAHPRAGLHFNKPPPGPLPRPAPRATKGAG